VPHGEADDLEVVEERGPTLLLDSGCSHAGAVNVLRNAQRLTGRSRIVGFVGGFHLTGAVFEPLIEPTIAAVADGAREGGLEF
jgi:7,8-dihydropterin-6-yl-methyl-4-(beta-D-ribofuranosyl)aminobenzene 5'-phosphate synthase